MLTASKNTNSKRWTIRKYFNRTIVFHEKCADGKGIRLSKLLLFKYPIFHCWKFLISFRYIFRISFNIFFTLSLSISPRADQENFSSQLPKSILLNNTFIFIYNITGFLCALAWNVKNASNEFILHNFQMFVFSRLFIESMVKIERKMEIVWREKAKHPIKNENSFPFYRIVKFTRAKEQSECNVKRKCFV